MTKRAAKLVPVNKLVVSMDICSSSRILEELVAAGNLEKMADLTVAMKNFISRMAKDMNATVYKFTGDGWIILFNESYDGQQLAEFLTGVSLNFQRLYHRGILPVLGTLIEMPSVKFGIDDGMLLRFRMGRRDEYIGQPLNTACRLQGLVTDADVHDDFQALISHRSYQKIGNALGALSPVRVNRCLRKMNGEKDIQCYKLTVSSAREQVAREVAVDELKQCHTSTQVYIEAS